MREIHNSILKKKIKETIYSIIILNSCLIVTNEKTSVSCNGYSTKNCENVTETQVRNKVDIV